MDARGHHPADLGRRTIADRAAQHDARATPAWLHEVVRLARRRAWTPPSRSWAVVPSFPGGPSGLLSRAVTAHGLDALESGLRASAAPNAVLVVASNMIECASPCVQPARIVCPMASRA